MRIVPMYLDMAPRKRGRTCLASNGRPLHARGLSIIRSHRAGGSRRAAAGWAGAHRSSTRAANRTPTTSCRSPRSISASPHALDCDERADHRLNRLSADERRAGVGHSGRGIAEYRARIIDIAHEIRLAMPDASALRPNARPLLPHLARTSASAPPRRTEFRWMQAD